MFIQEFNLLNSRQQHTIQTTLRRANKTAFLQSENSVSLAAANVWIQNAACLWDLMSIQIQRLYATGLTLWTPAASCGPRRGRWERTRWSSCWRSERRSAGTPWKIRGYSWSSWLRWRSFPTTKWRGHSEPRSPEKTQRGSVCGVQVRSEPEETHKHF